MATRHEYMTVAEAAELLRVNRETVYRMIHRREICGLRFGRSIRIPREQFQSAPHGSTPS